MTPFYTPPYHRSFSLNLKGLTCLIVAIVMLFALGACSDSHWKTKTSEGVVSVDFPGEVEESTSELTLPNGNTISMTDWDAVLGEFSLNLSFHVDSSGRSEESLQEDAMSLIERMQIKSNVMSDSRPLPKVGEVFKQWNSVMGREVEVLSVVYQKDNRIIQAYVVGPSGVDFTDASEKFIESISLP